MRILALRANGLVLPFIHASLVKAFQSLNVEVLDIPVPNSLDDFRSFLKTARKGFQAIFTLDLGGDHTFIKNIKGLQISLRIPWIIWFVDDPSGYGFPGACEPDWTIPFCWDREIVQENFSWRGMTMMPLPLAADPSIFFPEEPEETDSCRLYPGGVFAGSTAHPNEILERVARTTPEFREDAAAIWETYRKDFRQSLHTLVWTRLTQKTNQPIDLIRLDSLCRLWVQACVYEVGIRKRREVVCGVLNPGGGVFGDEGWRNVVGESLYRGWIAYGGALRKVYNGSTFILDVRQPQARTGLTQRIFDASACGIPVLAEWSPELELLFDPGDEPLGFYNPEGAMGMRELCLRDPRGARKRGEKARERVLAHHTYRNRAVRILQALEEFRR
jgi:spore maturation protein CgeB